MIYSTRPFEPQVLRVWLEEKTFESTQPESTQPESTQPESTQPESTQPESTQPESTQPESTQPESTQPESTQPESTQPESTNAHNLFFYAYCPNKDSPMEGCTAIGRNSGYSQKEIEYLMSKFSMQHTISIYLIPPLILASILLPIKITPLLRSSIASFNMGLLSAILAEGVYLSGQSLSLLSEDLHDSIHYANAGGLIKVFRLPNQVPISQFILHLERELTRFDRCHKTARGYRCTPYDKEDFIQ